MQLCTIKPLNTVQRHVQAKNGYNLQCKLFLVATKTRRQNLESSLEEFGPSQVNKSLSQKMVKLCRVDRGECLFNGIVSECTVSTIGQFFLCELL